MPRVSHLSSYFVWLTLAEEIRADQVAMALMRDRISVSTAEPFAASAQVLHAIRLALGSVDLDTLRDALEKVKRVIDDQPIEVETAACGCWSAWQARMATRRTCGSLIRAR